MEEEYDLLKDIHFDMVGTINFGDMKLNVYGDIDTPLFKAIDICEPMGYKDNVQGLLKLCEYDEIIPSYSGSYVTENGLYDILSQCNNHTARSWRRVVHDLIIQMRKDNGHNIVEQFDEWEEMASSIFYDDETGILMQSVTMPGGDVEQVPYDADNFDNDYDDD